MKMIFNPRRWLCFVASLILILSMVPASAQADEELRIVWLSEGEPISYNSELDWVSCLARESGQWTTYNASTGDRVEAFDYVGSFAEGLAIAGKTDMNGSLKFGFIDKNGGIIVPFEYDDATSFSDGMARVAKKDMDGSMKYGFIDKNGKVVVPFEYDFAYDYQDGLARVAKMDAEGSMKYGFIDKNGKVVVPFEYDFAYDYQDGLARVAKMDAEGRSYIWGFVDINGTVLIPLENDGAGCAREFLYDSADLCWVKRGLSYGIFKNPYSTTNESGPSISPMTHLPIAVGIIAVTAVALAVILLAVKRVKKNQAAPAPAIQPALATVGFCPHCGAKSTTGTSVCQRCGKALPINGASER